ncbi:MAG: folylpolyglutamate synthase/dihydrofolate synthase family protein [Pseudomonadota bacterium]
MSAPSGRLERALASLAGHYPQEIELSLGRIERLLERLGRPHHALPPTVHVAGTNGKGSTCAFLRAMAEAAGLRVHVFTSPHLVRFNERIRLAGELITDAALAGVLERVKDALGSDEITHFEATTAAALLAFAEVPADLLILEVGLGGRYDATNIIPGAAVSVISPIDIDHKQFLGDTIAEIAREKAGIIRPGTPVVSARQHRDAARIVSAEAAGAGAPLHVLSARDVDAMPRDLALKGAHQRANAALAAKALRLLGDERLTETALSEGASRAHWPARLQRLAEGPVVDLAGGIQVWLDGGHNPHAAQAVADVLAGEETGLALVAAMMASKDAQGFFAPFSRLAPRVFTCPIQQSHQGYRPEDLAAAAGQVGLTASACETLEAALDQAGRSGARRILICGSLYLAGEVLTLHGAVPD